MGNFIGNAELFLKKYGPSIMVGAGCAGAVGSAVWACGQTIKMSDLLDEAKEAEDTLEKLLKGELRLPSGEDFTEEKYKKQKAVLQGKTMLKIGKLYAGPAAVMAVSLGLIVFGHKFVCTENAALSGALASATGALAKYRAAHPDTDKETFFGKETTNIVQNPETGAIEEIVKKLGIEDGVGNYYAKAVFDESNPNFTRSHYDNIMFLRVAEHDLQNRMDAYGHIWQNEVRRYLALKEVPEGQFLGALSDGVRKIDFGLKTYIDEMKGDLEEGSNRVARPILLDLSCVSDPIMNEYAKAFGKEAAQKLLKH